MIELTQGPSDRYSEAIDILYRNAVFDLGRTMAIERMQAIMLPQRLQSIRSIRYRTVFKFPIDTSGAALNRRLKGQTFNMKNSRWPLYENEAKWPGICRFLASLQNLDQLLLSIHITDTTDQGTESSNDESILFLLKHLKQVRANRFVVMLPEAVSDMVLSQLGTVPFTMWYRNMSDE